MAEKTLPTGAEILVNAYARLLNAQGELQESLNWVTAVDSPLTSGERAAIGATRRAVIGCMEIIEQVGNVVLDALPDSFPTPEGSEVDAAEGHLTP